MIRFIFTWVGGPFTMLPALPTPEDFLKAAAEMAGLPCDPKTDDILDMETMRRPTSLWPDRRYYYVKIDK